MCNFLRHTLRIYGIIYKTLDKVKVGGLYTGEAMAEAKKGKTGGAKKKADPAAKAKKKGSAKGDRSAKGVEGKAAKRPVKVTESKVAATKRNMRDQDLDDSDELPPDDVVEGEAASLDAETLASEVERAEAKDREEGGDDVPALLPAGVVDDDADGDADAVLPSMEGLSILRETELNDVIQDVKRRSEANGGYITYEELNQILPSNIVDAIQSDKYLKILEALGCRSSARTTCASISTRRARSSPTRRRVRRT